MQRSHNDKAAFFLAVGLHATHGPYVVSSGAKTSYVAARTYAASSSHDEELADLSDLPTEALALIAGRDGNASDADIEQHLRIESRLHMNEYLAREAEADFHVGTILRTLDATGLNATTSVLLTSDHGVHLGEKSCAVGAKWTLWERTSHVPFFIAIPPRLVIALPGGTMPGSRFPSATSLVDIFPTIMDIAGIPSNAAPHALAGTSLIRLLATGGARGTGDDDRSVLVTHCPGRELLGYAVRNSRFRYIRYRSRAGVPAAAPWTIADGRKLESLPCELYDLHADPAERINLLRAGGGAAGHFDREAVVGHWWYMEQELQRLLQQQRCTNSSCAAVR